MANSSLALLMITAVGIGFIHTILGPDHYLPFLVLSKARKWSILKTLGITFFCGLGHVLSSIVLGIIGIILGIVVFRLEVIESFRGEVAAWLLLGFGFFYFLWGLNKAIRSRPHKHIHFHEDGSKHVHEHNHGQEHLHIHQKTDSKKLTPWILFIIFILSPCEPLVPLLMYPAAKGNIIDAWIVGLVFGASTIFTMLGIVFISFFGLSKLPLPRLQRYSHALAGAAIFLCGGAIKFLGL